jgi:hypothetical protein
MIVPKIERIRIIISPGITGAAKLVAVLIIEIQITLITVRVK